MLSLLTYLYFLCMYLLYILIYINFLTYIVALAAGSNVTLVADQVIDESILNADYHSLIVL